MNLFDQHFLAHALRLAARGWGRTWPNPSVGCVIVKDNQVLAAARTADGGRPHAETEALAGIDARGATAYVSLEPCAHFGVTPPCAQALIDAGIARVVIAELDPDTRVAGRGIAMLQAAGIEVVTLPPKEKTTSPHRGFFRRVQHGMPYVALKIATSLDARIADESGASQWITGPLARAHGHRLRAQFDAVVTGIGTVLADDAQLTVRLPGLAHPMLVRIVCDRQLRLPLTSKLVKTAQTQPVWLITGAEAVERAASHATELREAGIILHVVEDATLAPLTILQTLGAAGLTRVLIEAGTALSTAFLDANAVDALHWYRAPLLLGNTGKPAFGALHTSLADAKRAPYAAHMRLGVDSYEHYELESCLPD